MTAIDHREEQGRVRDQGLRPTCASHAVTAAHDWLVGDERSVEWALWAADRPPGRADDEACWPAEIVIGLGREGHVPEAVWPYGRPSFPADPPSEAKESDDRPRLGPHRPVIADIATISEELRQGAPVVLTVGVERAAWDAAALDGWVSPTPAPASDSHAVLVVGAVPADAERSSALIIKNSWGRGWGDDGYGYITEDYLTSYGVEAVVVVPDEAQQEPTEEEGGA